MLLSIWIGSLMFALVPQILPVKAEEPSSLKPIFGITPAAKIFPTFRVQLLGYRDWRRSCGMAFALMGKEMRDLVSLGQKFCALSHTHGPAQILWQTSEGSQLLTGLKNVLDDTAHSKAKTAASCVLLGALVDARLSSQAMHLSERLSKYPSRLPKWCKADILLAEAEISFYEGNLARSEERYKAILGKYGPQTIATKTAQGSTGQKTLDSLEGRAIRPMARYRLAWIRYFLDGDPAAAGRQMPSSRMTLDDMDPDLRKSILSENRMFMGLRIRQNRRDNRRKRIAPNSQNDGALK